ncbi:hypothetical protein L8P23_02535 [Enterobacter roggenkampii]|uniref:glycine-rich domain-containing protein n=1 Tax=Enterobacter roggenkampii TaxID=1812935 RepID=UPI00200528CC|nr:hypothetical protein [Enterobacter roggenkampii]MCK7231002.1 hypothetical protein [Enterobacter roggenkampii]
MALTLLTANNAQTVLTAGISASATSLTVNSGTGALFPSATAGVSYFKLTLVDAATGQLSEIVHVTARSGDTMTITRGQEGTTARAWSANDIAANMLTAGTISLLAPLDSPALTGTPTVPTASPGTSTTQAASTAFVASAITAATGRLINIRVFTSSGTYTPTAGTTRVKVKAIGGGGAGGGAVATSTGVSAGGGGGSGAYAEGYYTSGFSGLTVTIGAAGASASGAVGGNGGTTSFGALISCPGGGGGQIGTASNTTIVYSSQGAPGGAPTGSGLIVSGKGQPGQNGAAIGTAGIGIGGIGSPSPFGGGGTQAVNADNGGVPATSYGSGGGGTCNTPSQSAHSGGGGAPGVVIIEEYA